MVGEIDFAALAQEVYQELDHEVTTGPVLQRDERGRDMSNNVYAKVGALQGAIEEVLKRRFGPSPDVTSYARRIKRLSVTPDLLFFALRDRDDVECFHDPIPADAELDGVNITNYPHTVEFILKSDSFELVQDGFRIPDICPCYRRKGIDPAV